MKSMTPKEIATEWDANPKRVRKFLRRPDSGISDIAPGKGGRWAIPANRVKTLQKRFIAWNAEKSDTPE